MEPRDRVLGPIASESPERGPDGVGELTVDFGSLVRKLILSEEVIISSNHLREFSILLQKFGYDGVKEMLRSGRVRILRDHAVMAQIGQYGDRLNGPVLPPGSYSFSALTFKDPPGVNYLRRIADVPGLREKQARKIRQLVRKRIMEAPADRGGLAQQQLLRDLEDNVSSLRVSTALVTKRLVGGDIRPGDFDLRVERLSEYDWRTETNLSARAGLTPQQTHNAVEQGILGIGGLNIQLELMQRYAALTGFRLEDLPLVEEKFESVVRQIDPQAKEARFDRVLELTQLPQVDPDVTVQDVDLARLIEITSGAEAAEFRRWVRGVDAFTDGELKEAFHPVRDAIGNAVRSKAGKAMRIATTSGAGVLVPPVGIGLGVLDMFVTEKILPGPGPTAFLSRLYPSVFQTTSLT